MKFLIFLAIFFSIVHAADSAVAQHAGILLPSVVKVKIQRTDAISEENELIQSDSGGSGFVMDDEHHIVTNEHVIRDAKKIFIIDNNNIEYIATLIAKDEKSDIALLEVPLFNAPKLPMGDSSKLFLGENVFVIGAPYSLGSSVTVGVISSLKRSLQNYPYQYFIQTDAAINPGNSGGPLCNRAGEAVGVATMTFSRSGSYTNIGFAIPIEEALRVANALIRDKKIIRGYLGAELLISDKVSRRFGYQASTLITRIESKSPAALAGLRAGDIIIGVNDEKFSDNGSLHRLLYTSKPNDLLKLSLIRDKKNFTATVKLGEEIPVISPLTNAGTGDSAEKLGLVLSETPQEVLVILSYGIAKTAGFMKDDVLLKINGTSIKTIKECNLQLSKLKENEITTLTLRRNGELISLPLGSKTALAGYATSN